MSASSEHADMRLSSHVIPATDPELEYVVLCKAGPAGTYTFDATATHAVLLNTSNGLYNQTAATYTITVGAGDVIDGTTTPGACFRYSGHNHIALAGGSTDATVTVVESGMPANITFEKAGVYQKTKVGAAAASTVLTETNVNSAAGRVGGDGATPRTLWGATLVFTNVEMPPPPTQGETATGAGFPWSATQGAPSNWFMYTPWTTMGSYRGISEPASGSEPAGTDLIAGQTYVAGRITGTRGLTTTITITLNSAFLFSTTSSNVKIYPMSCTTAQPYVQPGKFTVKRTALQSANSITVTGLANTACYGIHVDVVHAP